VLNILWRIRNLFLSLFYRKTVGARALVIKDNQVLLVKHTYISGWYTIGGAIDKGESPLQALQRELKEEAGLICLGLPKLFGAYYNQGEGRDDYIFFYTVKEFEEQAAFFSSTRNWEIQEAKWFSLDALPTDISPATLKRIEEYQGVKDISDTW